MTRVILSLSVLDYCEGMAELIHEVFEKPAITGVSPRKRRKELSPARRDLPALRLDGLLEPPRIEALDPCLFPAEDQVDGFIQITASGDYGVMNVYVTLEDDRGKQIESGFAFRDEVEEEDWYYLPSASLRSGASVTVRTIAMDALGGVGIQDENVIV